MARSRWPGPRWPGPGGPVPVARSRWPGPGGPVPVARSGGPVPVARSRWPGPGPALRVRARGPAAKKDLFCTEGGGVNIRGRGLMRYRATRPHSPSFNACIRGGGWGGLGLGPISRAHTEGPSHRALNPKPQKAPI